MKPSALILAAAIIYSLVCLLLRETELPSFVASKAEYTTKMMATLSLICSLQPSGRASAWSQRVVCLNTSQVCRVSPVSKSKYQVSITYQVRPPQMDVCMAILLFYKTHISFWPGCCSPLFRLSQDDLLTTQVIHQFIFSAEVTFCSGNICLIPCLWNCLELSPRDLVCWIEIFNGYIVK